MKKQNTSPNQSLWREKQLGVCIMFYGILMIVGIEYTLIIMRIIPLIYLHISLGVIVLYGMLFAHSLTRVLFIHTDAHWDQYINKQKRYRDLAPVEQTNAMSSKIARNEQALYVYQLLIAPKTLAGKFLAFLLPYQYWVGKSNAYTTIT